MKETNVTKAHNGNKHRNPFEDSKENMKEINVITHWNKHCRAIFEKI